MSRGRMGFLTSLVLLGLGVALINPSPVSAQLTVSGSAAGTDDLDPVPVASVTAKVDLAVPNITIAWTISDDDFVRQAPVGGDFTSSGTFSNVNDVAGYNVWRDDGPDTTPVIIKTLASGDSSYVDADVTNGVFYNYSVTAFDAAGNESGAVSIEERVNVGSPPEPVVVPPEPEDEETEIVQVHKVAITVETSDEDEALLLDPDPTNTEAVQKQEAAIDQLVDFLLDNNPGLKREQIRNFRFVEGSVIIVFDIVDDPEDEDAPTAAETVQALEVLIEEEPETLVESLDVVEEVAELNTSTLVDVDFGTLGLDETTSQSFTYTNNAIEDDAILFLTISVEGDGYAVDTDELAIDPGESESFSVSFDAAEVDNLTGTYEGTLTVLTNDPNQRENTVNLTVDVDALVLQDIDLIGSTFAFGNVSTNTTQARTMTVRNLGDFDLSGTLALDGDAVFTIDESSFLLARGETLDVSIEFSPTGEVDYSATITITSDDPANPELSVPLTGTGVSGEEVLLETDDDGNLVTDDDGNSVIILGDFDGSADVGFQDFFIFADNFGADDFNPATDLDNTGDVGFQDFFIFADNFGKSGVYQVQGAADGTD